ncbi:hypothetical protein [Mesorhizobium sp. SP-1A]|uniref:hypothetical protein n=1 Tax=Mesorhizobium sp. SP-1A TaxID=3077840 RepID=UPI0028F7237F|nr:hypothetical protein [Mesorhizobium sp. SP-1A]
MTEDGMHLLEPHLSSRKVNGTALWCVRIKNGAGDIITLSQETVYKPVAARDLRRIHQEMSELWLKRNAARIKEYNPIAISKRDDFLKFRMYLYDRYRPLENLPSSEPCTEYIAEGDQKMWKSKTDVFTAAYISTKHPSWTVQSVSQTSSILHDREVIVEKDAVQCRILFWVTNNAFHHKAVS